MVLSEIKRIHQLQDEKRQLKGLVADAGPARAHAAGDAVKKSSDGDPAT